jgi:tripartite-type tricarboxylate transporter receptor subunit TctC
MANRHERTIAMKRFGIFVSCCLAAFALSGTDAAVAQGWPTAKPITMVVPFPPGPLDLMARLVGGKLGDALARPSWSRTAPAPTAPSARTWSPAPRPTATYCSPPPPSSWFGFLGPPALPPPIVTRFNGEMVKALNAPDVRGKLEDNGFTVIGGPPERLAALMADGIERYGAIIKAAGIQPE